MRREILDGRPWVMTEEEDADFRAWMRAFEITSPSRP
jgi:hypothetical protein